MEIATIVETATAVGPELIVLFFVLVGLYNKNVLIAAKRLTREDPAGKALRIIDNADIDTLEKVVDNVSYQVKIAQAKKEDVSAEAKTDVYDGIRAAVEKKSLSE